MKKWLVVFLLFSIVSSMVLAGCTQNEATPTVVPTTAAPVAEVFNLSYSTQWPEQSGHFRNIQKPILDEIEANSNGRIKFKVFAGGSLGGGDEQYDIVRTGKADMATTTTQYTPGLFPLSDVLTFPGAYDSSYASEEMTLAVLDKWLYKDFADTEILSLQQAQNIWVYTKDKAITKMEDMKGLKLRSGGGMVTSALESVGAIPISMAMPDAYMSVQTGVIDGVTAGPSGIFSFKVYEVLKHELKFNVGFLTDIYVMNSNTWKKLPADLQKVVKDAARKGGKYEIDTLQKEMAPNTQEILSRGGSTATLSDAEAEKWIESFKPIVKKWQDSIDAKGYPSQDILNFVREECQKRNVTFPY